MSKIIITQIRSKNGCTERQKRTLRALGLKRINHTIEHTANPQIIGMARKLNHLLKIEIIDKTK